MFYWNNCLDYVVFLLFYTNALLEFFFKLKRWCPYNNVLLGLSFRLCFFFFTVVAIPTGTFQELLRELHCHLYMFLESF